MDCLNEWLTTESRKPELAIDTDSLSGPEWLLDPELSKIDEILFKHLVTEGPNQIFRVDVDQVIHDIERIAEAANPRFSFGLEQLTAAYVAGYLARVRESSRVDTADGYASALFDRASRTNDFRYGIGSIFRQYGDGSPATVELKRSLFAQKIRDLVRLYGFPGFIMFNIGSIEAAELLINEPGNATQAQIGAAEVQE